MESTPECQLMSSLACESGTLLTCDSAPGPFANDKVALLEKHCRLMALCPSLWVSLVLFVIILLTQPSCIHFLASNRLHITG